MAKKKAVKSSPTPASPPPATTKLSFSWILAPIAVVVIAYCVPLLSDTASIHWDAVDVHYSAQRYFADHLLHRVLPHWTPYIFAGFPFLADPQTGGWYPGNWPFLLAGAGPKAIEAELAAHALLAALGVYLLLRRWLLSGAAAAIGALCYSMGGFFAGHSSHIGIFESAALFPWLVLALLTAVEGQFWKAAFWGTLIAGSLILAGHFQTALYVFTGLVLLAVPVAIANQPKQAFRKVLGFLAIVALGGFLLSAVQTLPGLELTRQSLRNSADYSSSSEGVLEPRGLLTLILPDSLGATSGGEYRGPGDITQYYFYAGFLLLPLAALGTLKASARPYAFWLGIPALLYMAGPALGFFRLVSWLPGFRQIRAPIHAWFLLAFVLALLAAAGVDWLAARWKWAPAVAIAVLAIDLSINNLWNNPLAYAHESFATLYGDHMDMTGRNVAPNLPKTTRFEAPDQLAALGPMNHPLDLHIETTYGYNPLQLSRYSRYRSAIARNPRLRDALSVSRGIDTKAGALTENPSVLPRAYFPRELVVAPGEAEALRALDALDPPRQAILESSLPNVEQDPSATAAFEEDGEQAYRIPYKSAKVSVLRVATPYFPGWEATVDGVPCPVLRADYAMMAIVVPAGAHTANLRFHSTWFAIGAALSGCGLILLAALAALGWKRRP